MQTPFKKQPQSVFANFATTRNTVADVDCDIRQEAQAVRSTPCTTLQDEIDSAIARGFIYGYLARSFETPSKKGWKWVCKPDVKQALRQAALTLTNRDDSALSQGAQALSAAFHLHQFETVAATYIAAFGHTVRGDCPMNEIEYGDIKADALFQPHRLADLAAFYSAFGLQTSDNACERQDHICMELEFMAVLMMKEAYALENQLDQDQLATGRDAQKKFLHEHLARWTPAFCRRLAKLTADTPMQKLAQFTQNFIAHECERFGLTPGSEDLMLRPVDETAERLCESCGINNLPPGALSSL